MGAYCTRGLIPRHAAKPGEVMQVLWSDYYGGALFGDKGEIACIPHKGCSLEIVASGQTRHRAANLLLPGQVIRYTGSFLFIDRFRLPSGTQVCLGDLVGFKLRLASAVPEPVPVEEEIIARSARAEQPLVTVG